MPYDADALDSAVLDEAGHSHPHVSEQGISRPSADYTETAILLASDGAMPEPAELAFGPDDLHLVRAFVTERARPVLDRMRQADLVLAVNELASNTIRHGGGRGKLRTWQEPGALLVEVLDRGFIEDLLAGRERPPDLSGGGGGLWLVNHLCDLVQMRSSQGGSAVRLHMSM